MITLYQYSPAMGLRCPSPFCLKLETYLRMAKLPYKIAPNADVRKSPKGKLPYITDGDKTIADSGIIIDYLKATYGDPLDEALSAIDRATMLAYRRLMEEHLYWVEAYARWIEDDNWPVIRKTYFSGLPPVLAQLVPAMVRKQVVRDLQGHGMGRHQRAEIYILGNQDLQAISDFLGDKPYMMGDQVTSLDATAYGFMMNALHINLPSPMLDFVKTLTNIADYCDRISAEYWSDIETPQRLTSTTAG